MGSGVSIQCIQITSDAYYNKLLRSFWGHSLHFRFATTLYRENGCPRVKRSEIWASDVSIQCVPGTFDSKVLNVITGSFGAFPIFSKS